MKIITDKAVYVQKNDMIALNQFALSIPASIFMKVYGNEITIIDDTNRFEFVSFDEKSEIEFFKELDWIVDYDSVKDLEEAQIIELGQNIAQQRNDIAKKYNAMNDIERRKNEHMIYECEKLDFKMYSLRDILWFKQGHIQFSLPSGVEYPKGYETIVEQKNISEKGLRRILRKFKRKK